MTRSSPETNEQIALRAVENAETAAQLEIKDPELRDSLIRNFAQELNRLAGPAQAVPIPKPPSPLAGEDTQIATDWYAWGFQCGMEASRKAALAVPQASAQAGREPIAPIHQEDAYAEWAKKYDAVLQTLSSDAERIAQLQYESGMYKSLYENAIAIARSSEEIKSAAAGIEEIAAAVHEGRFSEGENQINYCSFDDECTSGRAYCRRIAHTIRQTFDVRKRISPVSRPERDAS